MNLHSHRTTASAVLTAALLAGAALAASNVAPSRKFSWSENAGWLNWRDADSANSGVRVYRTYCSGYAWGENIGWINFGSGAPAGGTYANTNNTNFGVNIGPSGECSGYAWGENVGWINFNTVPTQGAQGARYSVGTARFTGYAWGENIGWINLDDASAYICALLTDLNADGIVNTADLTQLLVKFGQSVPAGSGPDFDSSGAVNTADLTQLLVQFGRTCP